MVTDDGLVKVLDFGLAELAESSTLKSETGTVERHVAGGVTREDENDGAGLYTRGQAPPSTTSGLVVCGQLD